MPSTVRDMVDSCLCTKLKATARSVTNVYDEALRPTGLRASQLAVLAAVATEESASITALAAALGMDRTTLSRNLGPLEKAGLVGIGAEGRYRSRTLEITNQGEARLMMALSYWEKAQAGLRSRLREDGWAEVGANLERLRRAAA